MSVTFLSPAGALVGLVVLAPLTAAALRERRAEPVRRALGLRSPERRLERSFWGAAAALFALAALAATQPVLRLEAAVSKRTDAEVFLVLDASRSMLAAGAPGAPTRFERARELGRALQAVLPGVPVGIASMTDRTLPHLFPTVDGEAYAAVLARAVGVDRPPPAEGGHPRATTLAALAALARENYFSPRSAKRLVVVLTDGERRPFDVKSLTGKLERAGVGLVVVRLWDPGERVYRRDGTPEPGYLPSRSSEGDLARLGAASVGRRLFSEDDAGSAFEAARAYLGTGPLVESARARRAIPLAPYPLLAAGLPLAFLLVRRSGGYGPSKRVLHTVWSRPWPGSSRMAARRLPGARASPRQSSSARRSSTGGSSRAGA